MSRDPFRRVSSDASTAEFPGSLTTRERQIIEAYATHGTFKGAARAVCLSEHTVADYIKAARKKAGVQESVVLVARYLMETEAA